MMNRFKFKKRKVKKQIVEALNSYNQLQNFVINLESLRNELFPEIDLQLTKEFVESELKVNWLQEGF